MRRIKNKMQARRQYREEIASARMYYRSGMRTVARDERRHARILKRKFKL